MSGRKRILYVEQNTDGTTGGSHHCLLEIVKGLDVNKYEPLVVFYQNNTLIKEFTNHCPTFVLAVPSPVHLVNKSFPLSWIFTLVQKGLNFLKGALVVFRNCGFILEHRIDLVHLNNSPAIGFEWLLACKLLGKKCITHNRGKPRISGLKKFLARGFDAVICISSFQVDALRAQGLRSRNHLVIINDGIDAKKILLQVRRSREEIRDRLHIHPVQPLIGIVGNIKRWKGQEVVVRAVDHLREDYQDLRCLVIGDVSRYMEDDYAYFQGLQALVREKKLSRNVIFLGFREDVPELISALDILVHASITPEPFGRVILEGMVLEKPVVATKLGGPIEIIENGVSGLLIPPADETALAQAIDSLLRNQALRERIGKAGKQRVYERFLVTYNVQQIQCLYEKILS